MSEKKSLPAHRGICFEAFEAGQTISSSGRTITETDIVAFAGLTGDWSPLHTDAVYAAHHPLGQRVAHGMLPLAVAVALASRLGFLEETLLAFREIREWKFSQPVFIGDTIHMEATVTKTQAVPRLSGGLVTLEVEVKNQNNVVIQHGQWTVLVKGEPCALADQDSTL